MPWAPCCLNRVHLRRGWPPPPTPPSSPPRPWGGRTYCPPAPPYFPLHWARLHRRRPGVPRANRNLVPGHPLCRLPLLHRPPQPRFPSPPLRHHCPRVVLDRARWWATIPRYLRPLSIVWILRAPLISSPCTPGTCRRLERVSSWGACDLNAAGRALSLNHSRIRHRRKAGLPSPPIALIPPACSRTRLRRRMVCRLVSLWLHAPLAHHPTTSSGAAAWRPCVCGCRVGRRPLPPSS